MASGSESYKNGMIFGAVLGLAILFGSYVKQPILDFLNGVIPANYQFAGITAMAVIVLVCVIAGYIVDKS